MLRRAFHEDKLLTALAVATILLIVAGAGLGIWGMIQQDREQDACRDSGGYVERYNYRTIYVRQSCGSNCSYLMPIEVSDWRCAK